MEDMMSYNITGWKIRRIHMELPIDFDFQRWLRDQPNSTGKRWCLEDDEGTAVQADLATQAWELSVLGKEISGVIAGDKLIVTALSGWTSDFSGYLYSDVLLPLFKEFKGTLDAIVVWEGGDSIVQLSINDGIVEECNLDEEQPVKEHTLEDSIKEMQRVNEVYYRLFVDRNDQPCVVCMQCFDEMDYDQSRFINEERYESEELAEQALLALKNKAGMPLSALERLKLAAQQR